MQTNIHFVISRSFLLGMRNVLCKICTENQDTLFLCSLTFFFCENRTVCEKMWKNIVERGMLQMQIWRMRIACLLPKATNTYSHVV